MAKKTEAFQEYLEVRRLQEDLVRRADTSKYVFIVSSIIIYIIVMMTLFVAFRPSTLNFFKSSSSEEERIAETEKSIALLQKDNESIKSTVSKSASNSLSYAFLSNKVDELEISQKSLYDSVLLKPEDVITARILTEKFNLQNEQFIALKADFRRVNELLTQIMWTVIIGPILAIIGFFLKEKFFKRREQSF